MIHLRIAAYLCGLGEIGYSMMFLTPEFGPRNRLGVILTDLQLEPDPIYDGTKLCNHCMACVRECPIGAISKDKIVKLNLCDKEIVFAQVDCNKCDIGFRGAEDLGYELPEKQQYMSKTTKPGWWSPFFRKPPNLYNTGQAVCGARGCTRACMIQLEKRGVLKNKFKQQFRRRPVWRVDWDTEPQYPPDVAMPGDAIIGVPSSVKNSSEDVD